jgi:anti-sigma factor RsiW
MNPPIHNKRQLLELYLDGELSAAEVSSVEQMLEEDPAAVEYLDALSELRTAVRLPPELATQAASFDGLFDRVMSVVGANEPSPLPARSAELEMLAMAFLDGQLSQPADVARARGYLERSPQAREGVESINTIGALLRGTFEQAESRVDFEALSRRVERATRRIDEERTTATKAVSSPSMLSRVLDFIGGGRAVFTSALTAAAVVAIMLPMVRQPTPETLEDKAPTVINNYFMTPPTSVESVEFQPGFWGSYQAGDPARDIAPVIWITPETPSTNEGTGMEVEYDPAGGIPDGQPL